MVGADCGDLAGMVAGVDEVESAPLVDAERSKDLVTDGLPVGEDGLRLIAEKIKCGELFVHGLEETVAADGIG